MIFIQTLGTALIHAGDRRVAPASVRKFALLLHLCAERGRRHSRATLQDLIFPDRPERNAKHALREAVYELRQAGVRIASDPEGIEVVSEDVRADYEEVARCERLDVDQMKALEGGFLPGYAPDHSEAFAEWLEGYRARVGFALCTVLVREVARARSVGDWVMTEGAARACLSLDPVNEEATLALAEMLAIGGAKVQAVRLLDGYLQEVGAGTRDLKISAVVLKRRIGERVPDAYRSQQELPFAGRDDEMRHLRRLFDSARAGTSVCVIIAGEPGIGKTRLVSQFTSLAMVDGAAVVRATVQPSDVHRPMGAFVDLVPLLLQLPGALGCSPDSMTALSRLTRTKTDEAGTVWNDNPDFVSHTITRSIGDLLDAISAESPIVMVVEDAHWLDEHSARVMSELTASRAARRLMVIATTRDASRFQAQGGYPDGQVIVGLRGLALGVSRELCHVSLRGTSGESDVRLREWMTATADGNPLFLSTLAAHYRTTRAAFEVPPSLRELLARRLDTLTRQSVAVLQTCVVLGKRCTVGRLVACLDMRHVDLMTCVAELDSAHVIDLGPERVSTAHPLLAEVMLARSTELSKALTHRRVAEVLQAESTQPDMADLAWDCAEHWVAAGDDRRAFAAFRVCAERAIEIGRPRSAAEILMRAANLRISTEEQLNTLHEMIRVASFGNEHDLVLRGVERERSLAASRDHDDIELAELDALAATCRDSTDVENRAIRCVTGDSADPDHRVRAALMLLKYADSYGKPHLRRTVAAAVSAADLEAVEARLRLEFQMIYGVGSGDVDAATVAARALRAVAAALPSTRGAALECNIGEFFCRTGRLEECVEVVTHAHEVAVRCGAYHVTERTARQLAELYTNLGDRESAAEWLAKEEETYANHPEISDGLERRVGQIEVALNERDVARAAALLSDADALGIFTTPGRQRWQRALSFRLAQLRGMSALSEQDVATLLDDGTSHQMIGVEDVEVAVACFELVSCGREIEARHALTEYINSRRRNRGPLSVQLQQAMQASSFASTIRMRQ